MQIEAEYLSACDGVKSPTRQKLNILIDAHKGLNKTKSEFLNSQLILLIMDKVSEKDLSDMLQEILKNNINGSYTTTS